MRRTQGGIKLRPGILVFIFLSLGSVLVSAEQSYNWSGASEESYWYSLYNANALIHSGLGIPLTGRDDLLSRVIAEAGFARGDRHGTNDLPVVIPYSAGRPEYVQSGSQKWTDKNQSQTIKTAAVAWTILAYVEQAKQMERLYHIDIGQNGETKLEAMLRGVLASEAADMLHMKMRDSASGLYMSQMNPGDAAATGMTPTDQFVMLWALAELSSLAEGYSMYEGRVSWVEASQWAEELYQSIMKYSKEHPEWMALSKEDMALFIQSLSAFAATSGNLSLLEGIVDKIQAHAGHLAAIGADAPLELKAKAVRALITAEQMTGDENLRTAALKLWDSIEASWDSANGLFSLPSSSNPNVYEYSTWDVGDLAGAYGAVIYGAGRQDQMDQYAQFFHQVVKASRLMTAEGAEAGGSSDGDEVPGSASAGGPLGMAPVFASKVQFSPDTKEWHVSNSNFETDGAMYLATQLMWIGQRDQQSYMGPPRYGLPLSRETQFMGLQKQIAELSAAKVDPAQVDAMKTLLQDLEDKVLGIQKKLIGPLSMVDDLKAVKDQLDDINTRLKTVEEKMTASSTDSANASEQISQIAKQITDLSTRLKTLEDIKIADQLTALTATVNDVKARLDAADKAKAASRITNDQTITLILIVLIALVGVTAYQWVMRRSKREAE